MSIHFCGHKTLDRINSIYHCIDCNQKFEIIPWKAGTNTAESPEPPRQPQLENVESKPAGKNTWKYGVAAIGILLALGIGWTVWTQLKPSNKNLITNVQKEVNGSSETIVESCEPTIQYIDKIVTEECPQPPEEQKKSGHDVVYREKWRTPKCPENKVSLKCQNQARELERLARDYQELAKAKNKLQRANESVIGDVTLERMDWGDDVERSLDEDDDEDTAWAEVAGEED
jgi:hypothetical protein